MMTLEEAIKHCKDVALSCTNKECALEHFQLLKWLQEYSNMLEKQGETSADDFGEFINILSKQFPEVSFAKLSRIAVRVKKWLEKQGEQKLPIEKLPSETKTIGKSLGFTTQEDCDRYNQMVSDLIMSDDDKGEQKPADKAEPKFKVGETVKDPFGGVYHIIEINNDSYKTDDGRFILFENEGAYTIFTPAWFEKQASPLLSNSSNAGKNEQARPDIEEAIKEVEEKAKVFTEAHKGESSDDILAQMRGEQKPADCTDCTNAKGCLNCKNGSLKETEKIAEWRKKMRSRLSSIFSTIEYPLTPKECIKPTWSEEDEEIVKLINFALLHLPSQREDTRQECLAWLKSLKDRVK